MLTGPAPCGGTVSSRRVLGGEAKLLPWSFLMSRLIRDGQKPDDSAALPEPATVSPRPTAPQGSCETRTQAPGTQASVDRKPEWPILQGYEISGILGRGGMGVVYKAVQVGLKRVVALKMILAAEHASAEQTARFRSEAEAVARCQHPNIVQIHEVGEQNGLP